MARRPSVRWNESKQRWMAWVRFPDGSRRKVERIDRVDAERDLQELLALRAQGNASAPASRLRLATFGEVLDAWVEAGCPKAAVSRNSRRARTKSASTIATIGYLFDGHVRPAIGGLRVDRTGTERVEQVFRAMADAGSATSTIDHTWTYLNQACLYALRRGTIKTNPVDPYRMPDVPQGVAHPPLGVWQHDFEAGDVTDLDAEVHAWLARRTTAQGSTRRAPGYVRRLLLAS